jgi:hypothetical protein
MDDIPITFEDWETVLKTAAPPDRYPAWREAIVKFRYWQRQTGKSPTAATFREHLDWKKAYLTPERFEIRREALRWYYGEGLPRMKAAEPAGIPSATAEGNRPPTPNQSVRARKNILDTQPGGNPGRWRFAALRAPPFHARQLPPQRRPPPHGRNRRGNPRVWTPLSEAVRRHFAESPSQARDAPRATRQRRTVWRSPADRAADPQV